MYHRLQKQETETHLSIEAIPKWHNMTSFILLERTSIKVPCNLYCLALQKNFNTLPAMLIFSYSSREMHFVQGSNQ